MADRAGQPANTRTRAAHCLPPVQVGISAEPPRSTSSRREDARAAVLAERRPRISARAGTAHAPPAASMHRRRARSRGITLMEVLIALPIIAMLLAATAVAIDASFRAYGSAAEDATTQAATRMVVHRLLGLVRTSTAHGPLEVDPPHVVHEDGLLHSTFIELIDPQDNHIRLEYRPESEELWLIRSAWDADDSVEQPILGGVTDARFSSKPRRLRNGTLVLERATMDLTVEADPDATLPIESETRIPFRVFASTAPRKLE